MIRRARKRGSKKVREGENGLVIGAFSHLKCVIILVAGICTFQRPNDKEFIHVDLKSCRKIKKRNMDVNIYVKIERQQNS